MFEDKNTRGDTNDSYIQTTHNRAARGADLPWRAVHFATRVMCQHARSANSDQSTRRADQRSHGHHRADQRSHGDDRADQRSYSYHRADQGSRGDDRTDECSHSHHRADQRSHS